MKRFALNSTSILVKGAKRDAIYDLSSGNVYSIDDQSVAILESSQFDEPETEVISYLSKLQSLGLGSFVDNNHQISQIDLSLKHHHLDFAWLEVTPQCNLRCIHCYTGSNCDNLSAKPKDSMTTEQWQKILRDLISLDCKKIQFIGGEPLLFGKDLFALIAKAKGLGFEFIELYTNATLLTDEDIDFLSEHDVCVATSIYADNAIIHNRITQQQGSFDKTVNAVKKMRARQIKVRSAMVVSRYNESVISETTEFMNNLCGCRLDHSYDIARPVGRGAQDILSDKLRAMRLQNRPSFSKVTKDKFIQRLHYNSCWPGKICITSNGDVIPCIMARNEIAGNITRDSLNDIIQNGIREYWRLSKDKIAICKDCEYRYACNDCRPLVRGETDNLYAKSPDCLYNPYTGEWDKVKEVIDEQLMCI